MNGVPNFYLSHKKCKVFEGYLSYDELKTIDEDQALGIDLTRKEDYLDGNLNSRCNRFLTFLLDTEFVQVFGFDRKTFATLPKWKQDAEKKAAGLLE